MTTIDHPGLEIAVTARRTEGRRVSSVPGIADGDGVSFALGTGAGATLHRYADTRRHNLRGMLPDGGRRVPQRSRSSGDGAATRTRAQRRALAAGGTP